MTKKVRIEDADTSDYKVVVQTWSKGQNGEPDVMDSEKPLFGATDLQDFYIHSTRYLVVKEI